MDKIENSYKLSICIPTYGRVEILKNTLNSIINQKVSPDEYEICITDNSPTDETKELLEKEFSSVQNLHYYKVTCEGYLNSIEALKHGKGRYLKLHNNYTKLKENALRSMLSTVTETEDSSLIFFASKSISQDSNIFKLNSFNEFMNLIHYHSTWSSSFGIYKNQLDSLLLKTNLDKMFPHTSLLFAQNKCSSFVIDNQDYFENQEVGKKGGYNLPETFGTRYLSMVKPLLDEGLISENTYNIIKSGILSFINEWYELQKVYPEKYIYNFDGINDIILKLFDKPGLLKSKQQRLFYRIKFTAKKLLGK